MGLSVIKRDKRLYVMDGDRVVYTPPDFLRHRCNRDLLNKMATAIDRGHSEISTIVAFETRRRPK